MRNSSPTMRSLLFYFFLTSISPSAPRLYAQEYAVTVGALSSGAVKSSRQGGLMQQLRYSIPLTFNPQQIDEIIHQRPSSIAVSFPSILPLPVTITLHAFDVFTPEARSYSGTGSGDKESMFRSEWVSFRGELQGDPQSVVVMNFSRSGVDAMILMKGQTYFIRATEVRPTEDIWPHAFYAAAAVKQQVPFRCGVLDAGDPNEVKAIIQQLESQRNASKQSTMKISPLQGIKHDPPRVSNPFGAAISSDTIEVRVALEGDYELFLAMGSEQAALNAMMSTASYASAVYVNQATVKLTVPFIRVWTTANNPYTHVDLFASLDGFVNYWSQNMNNVDRSVAHLFTNSARWRNISGYVGVAKLNSLCSNLIGYGVTEVRQPAGEGHLMTFTHELGHNFGAHHTHSCFWPNGPLDYCAVIEEGSCYTGPIVQSDGTIMSYCTTRKFEFGTVVAGLIRRNAEFASCAPTVNRIPIAQSDSTFLGSLYTATNGSAWNSRTNWQSGPVSQRYGITVRGGQVISINLPANNLSGQIPSTISSLSGLRVLNLSGRSKYHVPSVAPPDPATDRFNGNTLTGQLPLGISQLSLLEDLDVSNNQLTGPLPAGITSLAQLRVLNLSENAFTGTIPSTIGNLTNLETLDLWRTWMSGPIPSSIGNLRSLRVLVLSSLYGSPADEFARLTGTIPPEIGNLSRLSVLDLSSNALTGQLPPQMGSLTSLTTLDLGANELSGPIPSEFTNLRGLSSLALNDNHLTGNLPAYLGTYSSLSAITVANNRLSGPLPVELGKLSNLLGLHLEDNAFTGPIPSSFGALTSLLDFDLHGNALTGTIPDSLRFLGTSAPPDFGGLIMFRVGDNKLTGPVPSWLSNRPSISQIDLGGNQLDSQNGPIPSWVFNRTSLVLLHLHGMGNTGTFPTQVLQFASLTSLKLSGNQLTGTIPSQIGTARNLNVLWLSDNKFTGSLPVELGNLLSLSDLRLSNNQFTGSIPSSLGNIGGQLQYLYLSGNKFTGSAPAEFETFGSLRQLALNDNELENISRLYVLGRALHDSAGFITLQNNRLTFSALADMMSANAQLPPINFTYAPQKPFGTVQVVTIAAGLSDTLKVTVDLQTNTYQWLKNGSPILGATKSTYAISNMSAADTGQYVATVKNTIAPLLTLQSQPFTVKLAFTAKPGVVIQASPADGAVSVSTNATLAWSAAVQAESYRVQVARDSNYTPSVVDTTVTTTGVLIRSLAPSTKYYWRVTAGNPVGIGQPSRSLSFTTSATISGIAEKAEELPREFRVEQNYPNPFNPSTAIHYQIITQSLVTLKVYDVIGREVAKLVEQTQRPGAYTVRWDAKNAEGETVPSGIYLYEIRAGSSVAVRKMVLTK